MLKSFFVLVLFAFLFAACSSGGGSGDNSQPSSSSYTPPEAKEDPDVTIAFKYFDIELTGIKREFLKVSFSAEIDISGAQSPRFDSVLIKLGSGKQAGKILNADKITSTTRSFQWAADPQIDVSSVDCGQKVKVCYEVYANGNGPLKIEGQQDYCKEETRTESYCAIQSSSSEGGQPSVALNLVPVSFGGNSTIKITSTEGVNLSTGTSSGAYLFFNPGSPSSLETRNGVQITEELRRPEDAEGNYPGISKTDLPNPAKTSEVTPKVSTFKTSVDYKANDYYLVKVSGNEWGSGWFLLLGETETLSGDTYINIKAWKVQ